MPMKRNMFSLAALLIMIFVLSIFQFWYPATTATQVTATAQVVNDTVIQNGGFEQGLTGWAHEDFFPFGPNSGRGFVAATDENAHGGNYSMKTSSSFEQQAYFYQYIDFPNTKLCVQFLAISCKSQVSDPLCASKKLGRQHGSSSFYPCHNG